MPAIVRKSTVAALEADDSFPALLSEYGQEAAIQGLPPIVEKIAAYHAIEASGVFQLYCAYLDDKLVGFVSTITPVLPHYGVAITVAESLFVGAEYRHSGAGLQLIRAAEQHARDSNSPGILFSAPSGGVLAQVLPGLDYRETNIAFFKDFIND